MLERVRRVRCGGDPGVVSARPRRGVHPVTTATAEGSGLGWGVHSANGATAARSRGASGDAGSTTAGRAAVGALTRCTLGEAWACGADLGTRGRTRRRIRRAVARR